MEGSVLTLFSVVTCAITHLLQISNIL